jgi:hypothetical protein
MSAATELAEIAVSNIDYSAAQKSWLTRARPWICKTVPFIAGFCFLTWWIVMLRSDFSWDDAEPEILDQAWRLANGESIYRDIAAPPYAIPIYPPLYLAAVAILLKWTGLSYLPARLISLFAGLAICWALISLDKSWNKKGQGGIWTGFLLFLIPAFLYNVLRSHVQMMAVALSIWSLVFFLRNRRMESLIVSPLFAVLAFYTKQTQIALPVAIAVYLAICNRRWLLPYLAVMSMGILVPFLWLQKITGGHFFLDAVQLARLSYRTIQIPQVFIHHAGPAIIFICIACWTAYKRFRRLEMEPIDFYLIFSLLFTVISLGRVGAHGQYVIELLVVTLASLLRMTGLPVMRKREAWVSAQVLLLLIYAPFFVFFEEGLEARAANRASAEIYKIVQGGSGPILSQQGSFPLFSRGGIYIQMFHFASLSRNGLWDQTRLTEDVSHRIFSYVITQFPIEDPDGSEDNMERFTPEAILALRENYQRLHWIYPYYLYTPRIGAVLRTDATSRR